MSNHVENRCRPAQDADTDTMIAALAPGAETVSPLADGPVFRNPEDLRARPRRRPIR